MYKITKNRNGESDSDKKLTSGKNFNKILQSVGKKGSENTEELSKALMEELNCETAFTIPVFGGIPVAESVVVTWIIMAVLLAAAFS